MLKDARSGEIWYTYEELPAEMQKQIDARYDAMGDVVGQDLEAEMRMGFACSDWSAPSIQGLLREFPMDDDVQFVDRKTQMPDTVLVEKLEKFHKQLVRRAAAHKGIVNGRNGLHYWGMYNAETQVAEDLRELIDGEKEKPDA